MYSAKRHSSHISFGFTIMNEASFLLQFKSPAPVPSWCSWAVCAAPDQALPQQRFSYDNNKTTKKPPQNKTEGFNEHLCPVHRGYWDWQKERKTKDWIVNTKSLTSTVKGTAAERGWHSCGWFLWFGLHNNLIALHETLTNKLLKHLLGCHLHSFLISPEHKG